MLWNEWKKPPGRQKTSNACPCRTQFHALPILHGSTGCEIKNHRVWGSNAKQVRWKFADLLRRNGEYGSLRVRRQVRHTILRKAAEKTSVWAIHSSSPLLQQLSLNPIVMQMIHFTPLRVPPQYFAYYKLYFETLSLLWVFLTVKVDSQQYTVTL